MKAVLHHIAYELRSGFRDKSRLLMLYLFPLAYSLLMGGLMGKLNPLFIERMIPSLTVFSMMCAAFLSLPAGAVSERASGIYRSYKINAVPRSAIVFVPVAALAVHELIVTFLIIALAALAFGAPLPKDLPGFAAAWICGFGALHALGWAIATVARNDRAAILISQLLYIPSIMLGGLMIPAAAMPRGLALASLAFPATYSMRAFGADQGGWTGLIVLCGICLAGFAFSLAFFKWENR